MGSIKGNIFYDGEIENDNNIIKCPDLVDEPHPGGVGCELFEEMTKHKDEIAQIDTVTGEKDLYKDYLQRCIRIALALKQKGISQGDIITICSHNHLNSAVAFIAAQFVGAISANLERTLSHREILLLLKQISPKIIFASVESVEILEKAIGELSLDTEIIVFGKSGKYADFQEFLKPHPEEENFKPDPVSDVHNTCVIHFSSGSTGLPKGICLSHYTVLKKFHFNTIDNDPETDFAQENMSRISFPISFISYASLYWISGVIIVVTCILRGCCNLICNTFDPVAVWYTIDKYKPLFMCLLPVRALAMCKTGIPKDVDVKSLLHLAIMGAPISAEQMVFIRETLPECDVFQCYGQTETAGGITCFNAANKHHRKLFQKKPGSCGLPLRGIWYKVVDPETNQTLGPNQKGELRLKTEYLMNGYYKLDSSEAFDEENWFKTGDIVYYDEDYCFYVVDRIKEVLKYDGHVIAPVLIEMELQNHPAVNQAVVIGIPGEKGDHLMGLVVVNEDWNVGKKEIEEFVAGRLPEWQRLKAGVRFVGSFPARPNGKINRMELKRLVLNKEI